MWSSMLSDGLIVSQQSISYRARKQARFRLRNGTMHLLVVDSSKIIFNIQIIVIINSQQSTYMPNLLTETGSISMPYTLLTLPMLALFVSGILDKPRGLYIDRVTIWNATAIPTGYTATISWSQTLPTVVSSALSIFSFQMTNNLAILSFNAEWTLVNETNGQLAISPVGPDSYINRLQFSVLIVTDTSSVFELVTAVHQINTLVYVPPLYYQSFFIYSSKYSFTTSSQAQLISNRFYQWLELNSSSIDLYYAATLITYIPGSSAIQVKFCSSWANTFHKIKIGLLLFDNLLVNSIATYQYGDSYGYIRTGIFPSDFSIPTSKYGQPYNSQRCIFGWLHITTNISVGPVQFSFQLVGSVINSLSLTNNTLRSCYLYIACFASCPQGQYLQTGTNCLACTVANCKICSSSLCYQCKDNYLLSTALNSCIPCSYYIPHCSTCSSTLVCTKCSPQYILASSNASCLPCSSFINDCHQCTNQTYCTHCFVGISVSGSCTTYNGCVQAAQTAISSLSICTLCDSFEFNPAPANGMCVCKQEDAFIVSSHCTTVAGCIATHRVGDIVYCMACNINQGYQYDPSTFQCLCVEGYSLQSGICADACGDGKIITSQCDDGNVQDGDGCSSICSVEVSHRCTSNATSVSSCQYVGRNLSISLTNIHKTQGLNQGVFTFVFSPAMPLLNKFNFSQYFHFFCSDATYQIASWSYSHGKVTLIVDYQTDLEGRQASANFSFNQLFIRHSSISLQFTIKSDGVMLVIGDESNKSLVVRYIFLSASIAALFILIFGSWAHRMAGLQLVTSLQLIYYVHFCTLKYTPALSSFQELSIVGLNDLFLQSSEQNFNGYSDFQKVDFSLRKTELTNVGASLFILSIGVFQMILLLLAHRSSISASSRLKLTLLTKGLNNYLLLPVCLYLFLPLMVASLSISTRFNIEPALVSSKIRALCTFVSMAICSLSFCLSFSEMFIDLKNKNDPNSFSQLKKGSRYIPFFQLYIFMQVLFIVLWIRTANLSFHFFILLTQLSMIIGYITVRPHKLALDNVSSLMNFSLGFAFLTFIVLRQKGALPVSDESDVFCIFLQGIMLCFCVLLTMIRVFLGALQKLRECCKQSLQKQLIDSSQEERVDKIKDRCLGEQYTERYQNIIATKRSHWQSYIKNGGISEVIPVSIKECQKAPGDQAFTRLVENMKKQFRKARTQEDSQKFKQKTQEHQLLQKIY